MQNLSLDWNSPFANSCHCGMIRMLPTAAAGSHRLPLAHCSVVVQLAAHRVSVLTQAIGGAGCQNAVAKPKKKNRFGPALHRMCFVRASLNFDFALRVLNLRTWSNAAFPSLPYSQIPGCSEGGGRWLWMHSDVFPFHRIFHSDSSDSCCLPDVCSPECAVVLFYVVAE